MGADPRVFAVVDLRRRAGVRRKGKRVTDGIEWGVGHRRNREDGEGERGHF
jgi:hypothetical protein